MSKFKSLKSIAMQAARAGKAAAQAKATKAEKKAGRPWPGKTPVQRRKTAKPTGHKPRKSPSEKAYGKSGMSEREYDQRVADDARMAIARDEDRLHDLDNLESPLSPAPYGERHPRPDSFNDSRHLDEVGEQLRELSLEGKISADELAQAQSQIDAVRMHADSVDRLPILNDQPFYDPANRAMVDAYQRHEGFGLGGLGIDQIERSLTPQARNMATRGKGFLFDRARDPHSSLGPYAGRWGVPAMASPLLASEALQRRREEEGRV